MRLPILTGTVLAAVAFLAGCAAHAPAPAPIQAAKAVTATPPTCLRGTVDAQRAFILCSKESATAAEAASALRRPAATDLTIAAVADDYGFAQKATPTIEAATYAQIVGKTREAKSRITPLKSPLNIIDGRTFRKVSIDAKGDKTVTLFIEE